VKQLPEESEQRFVVDAALAHSFEAVKHRIDRERTDAEWVCPANLRVVSEQPIREERHVEFRWWHQNIRCID
jgi:hypothetical protein